MATSGGAGKDTVADYIVENLSNQYVKRSLGQPIHEIADRYCAGKVERHHLQDLGETLRTIFGENVWIRDADRFIENVDQNVVIPDVRKLIEFAHYRTEKGYLPLYIRVDRKVAKQRLLERDGSYNESDLRRTIEGQMNFIEELPTKNVGKTGLKVTVYNAPFNNIYIVDNSGSVEKLHKQLQEWWKIINEK